MEGIRRRQHHHFVLVHGLGHGAWCWYKVVALLKQEGHHVVALDLISNGINKEAPTQVKSIAHYSHPLLQYLHGLGEEKVILVGHSLGGCSLSYAMEMYPQKISKAIFIASFMPRNNQSYLGSAFPQTFPRLLNNGLVKFNYNENEGIDLKQPTSASFNLDRVKSYLYNESSEEDVCLAKYLLTSTPSAVSEERLHLTDKNYGSVRRFFVMTMKDNLFLAEYQKYSIEENPPERVFALEGSDHSPFFSCPLHLCNLLQKIACL